MKAFIFLAALLTVAAGWRHENGAHFYNIKSMVTATLKPGLKNGFQAEWHLGLLVMRDGEVEKVQGQVLEGWVFGLGTEERARMGVSGRGFLLEMSGGLMKSLRIHPEMPKWEVQLIRSFISQVQADVTSFQKSELPEFSTLEESITGLCEVKYNVTEEQADGETYLVFKKLNNFLNCARQPLIVSGMRNTENLESVLNTNNHISRSQENSVVWKKINDMKYQLVQATSGHMVVLAGEDQTDNIDHFIFSQTEVERMNAEDEDAEKLHAVLSSVKPIELVAIGLMDSTSDSDDNLINVSYDSDSDSLEGAQRVKKITSVRYFEIPELEMNEDIVEEVLKLVKQIEQEMEMPGEITAQHTLQRYSVLLGLVRRMELFQLEQVRQTLEDSDENTKRVFLDSVTNAGTLPALMILKRWLKNESKPQPSISNLASHVEKPTYEYLETFYDMMTDPTIVKQKDTNRTVVIVFSKLMRKVLTMNIPAPASAMAVDTIKMKYFPYLRDMLRHAVVGQDTERTQLYIRALANTAYPPMLKTFALYLNNPDFDQFEKAIIVQSLGTIVKASTINMDAVKAILYDAFADQNNSILVRVSSFYQIMKHNPSIAYLRKFQAYLNSEKDDSEQQLEQAVLNYFLSATEQGSTEEERENAKNLLNGVVIDVSPATQTSKVQITNWNDGSENFTLIQEVIGDKSASRAAIASSISMIYEKLGYKELDTIGVVIEEINKVAESVMGGLGMDGYDPDVTTRLNYLWDSGFGQMFYADENFKGAEWIELLDKYISDGSFKIQNFESGRVQLGFPLESGFPFLYTFDDALMYYLNANLSLEVSHDLQWNADVHSVFASHNHGQMMVMNTIEKKQYIAGYDTSLAFNLPVRVEFTRDMFGSMKLLLKPLIRNVSQRLFHKSTMPYHMARSTQQLQPVVEDSNTEYIYPATVNEEERFDEWMTIRRSVKKTGKNDEPDDVFLNNYPFNLTTTRAYQLDVFVDDNQTLADAFSVVFSINRLAMIMPFGYVDKTLLQRFEATRGFYGPEDNVLIRRTLSTRVVFELSGERNHSLGTTFSSAVNTAHAIATASFNMEAMSKGELLFRSCANGITYNSQFYVENSVGDRCDADDAMFISVFTKLDGDDVIVKVNHRNLPCEVRDGLCEAEGQKKLTNPKDMSVYTAKVTVEPSCEDVATGGNLVEVHQNCQSWA